MQRAKNILPSRDALHAQAAGRRHGPRRGGAQAGGRTHYGPVGALSPARHDLGATRLSGRRAARVWRLLHHQRQREGGAPARRHPPQPHHRPGAVEPDEAREQLQQVRLHDALRAQRPVERDADAALPQHGRLHAQPQDPQAGVPDPGGADPQSAHGLQRPPDLQPRRPGRHPEHLRRRPHRGGHPRRGQARGPAHARALPPVHRPALRAAAAACAQPGGHGHDGRAVRPGAA
mmetsp:Transcript_10752/g.30222  ORF Transcript_10752/g.30222 Transcript_10752/m.30222 type:complete len:233 (-) Transcript_10752:719-1417(-)